MHKGEGVPTNEDFARELSHYFFEEQDLCVKNPYFVTIDSTAMYEVGESFYVKFVKEKAHIAIKSSCTTL